MTVRIVTEVASHRVIDAPDENVTLKEKGVRIYDYPHEKGWFFVPYRNVVIVHTVNDDSDPSP